MSGDHPCSCGTCPHLDRAFGRWDYCNEKDFAIDPIEAAHAIELVGCLSHPLAREYLNKEVIEELESESKSLMSGAKKCRDICSLMKSEGIDITIKLLKEGVKK